MHQAIACALVATPAPAYIATAAADSPEVPLRDMIPYLAFHRDGTDEYFKHLVGQLKPEGGGRGGTRVCVSPA